MNVRTTAARQGRWMAANSIRVRDSNRGAQNSMRADWILTFLREGEERRATAQCRKGVAPPGVCVPPVAP